MNTNGWVEAAEIIYPHVVKLEMPDSAGSGFFIATRTEKRTKIAVLATAAHVVRHALQWMEPIAVTGCKSATTLIPGEYHMLSFEGLDLAIVEVPWTRLKLPERPLPTANPGDILPVGAPIAWCGYPNIVEGINCLFSGHISASVEENGDYLIDGVAIHGVSGGPAFVYDEGEVTIIGLLSQYLPNRETGESLPGLGVVRRINPLTQYFDGDAKSGTQKKKRQ